MTYYRQYSGGTLSVFPYAQVAVTVVAERCAERCVERGSNPSRSG